MLSYYPVQKTIEEKELYLRLCIKRNYSQKGGESNEQKEKKTQNNIRNRKVL